MVDHPQSVVDDCCYFLKFRLDLIYSFADTAIFRFVRFGLKLPIYAHFRVLGIFPRDDVTYHPNPQKAPWCAETRRLSHIHCVSKNLPPLTSL